ncbi:MAG: AbrB/MazE/SpoVT family DNA-binding domain-containing protein [Blastocatellia bacterium]
MIAIGQVKVNEQGGVEIPKSICQQVGIHPGATLLVEKNGDGAIWLRPPENGFVSDALEAANVEGEAELIEKNGLLVFRGVSAEILFEAIEHEREARMGELMKGISK